MSLQYVFKSNRSIVAIFSVVLIAIAVFLCGTAQADIFYYKLQEDQLYSFGKLTEDSSGNFQVGSALMSNLHNMIQQSELGQGFMPITYKGKPRLLFIETNGTSVINPGIQNLKIYNTEDLVNPVTNCNISSLSLFLTSNPAMWGDNVLLAGSFNNGTSGIVEVNPATGDVVNRYVRENSSYCDVTVCGNKIYARLGSIRINGESAEDFVEMSSVGVITDELTGFDYPTGSDADLSSTIICNELAALDGKLYANYQIGGKESGLLRFDSRVNPSAGTKVASLSGNYWVDPRSLSGNNDEFIFEAYNNSNIDIYLVNGAAPAVKIYSIENRTRSENNQTLIKGIESMYYDRDKGRVLFTTYDYTSRILSDSIKHFNERLIVLFRDSGGTFTVSQEIDGIDTIIVTDGSSSSADTPDTPGTPDTSDTPQTPDTPGTSDTPQTPANTSTDIASTGSSSSGGCDANAGTLIFGVLLFAVMSFRKR